MDRSAGIRSTHGREELWRGKLSRFLVVRRADEDAVLQRVINCFEPLRSSYKDSCG